MERSRNFILLKFPQKVKVIKTGYLMKRSKYLKFWKRRLVVLTNKNIYSFTGNEDDSECTMNLSLSKIITVEKSDEYLYKKFTFVIKERSSEYYFQASSLQETNDWLRCLRLTFINLQVIDEEEEIEHEKVFRIKNVIMNF